MNDTIKFIGVQYMSKILVVDDDGQVVKTTQKILKAAMPDYEVIIANSGQECIDKAIACKPDVILVDVIMPDMDGYEVCESIRSNDLIKHIPIIAITGYGNDSDVKIKILTAGADTLITKPIVAAELVAQVKAMLRIKAAEDVLRDELDYHRLQILDSSQNIRKVYEASFEGIIIVTDYKIISANKKFCLLYGYDFDEVIGKPVTNFISNDDYLKLLNDLEHGCGLECEYSGINKNGHTIYFEIHQEMITCDNKPAVLMVFHDITELKRNEQRVELLLDLSEKRFDSEEDIAQFALDAAVKLTNSEVGYLHFVNGDHIGDDIDGMTLDLFVWSSGAESKCTMAQTAHYPLKDAGIWADCIRTRKPSVHNDYESNLNKKGYPEGHFPVVRHMSVPVLNGGDALVAVMGVGNKIEPYTEFDVHQLQLYANSMWYIIKRKRLDIELKSYLDLAPTIFLALNKCGNIKALNRYGREILGCDNSIIGANWFDVFVTSRDRSRAIDVFNELLSGKTKFSMSEHEVITLNKNIRVISWRNTVLYDTKGDIETILTAGDDITEQRIAERELENHWYKERIRLENSLRRLSILGDNANKPKELLGKNV